MIRIITETTFGYWNGHSVEPKTKQSKPFELTPEREAELVLMGIAEYAGAERQAEETGEEKQSEEVAEEQQLEEVNEAPEKITIEYLEGMKLEQLKDFAEPLGVKYEFGMKKAELAQRAFEVLQNTEATSEEENPLDFDPSQAIV